jgi:hypothetical protein
MKKIQVELKRAEKVNEYGVKIVNRLVECRSVCSSGQEFGGDYYWYQDVIQPNNDKMTSQQAHYKRFAIMQDCMNLFNFNMK